MASTSLVDYQVLTDANFQISAEFGSPHSEEKKLRFGFPSDFVSDQGLARRPILAFKVRPFSDCKLFVKLDNREIVETSFDKSHTRGYWEVINTQNFMRTNDAADVIFRLTEGHARFGDVVLWYQIKR